MRDRKTIWLLTALRRALFSCYKSLEEASSPLERDMVRGKERSKTQQKEFWLERA